MADIALRFGLYLDVVIEKTAGVAGYVEDCTIEQHSKIT